jgi:hypothetical protein
MLCNNQLHVVLEALPGRVNEIMRESSPISNQYSVGKDCSHRFHVKFVRLRAKLLPFATWKDISLLYLRGIENNQAMMDRFPRVL